VTVLVARNSAKHTSLRDQFLAIRRQHRLALFRRHIRDLWLIGTTATDCAAYMRYAPDAVLICNEHKAFPVGQAIRGLEVVSIALDVVGLAVTILVAQQRQVPGPLFRNNDIVIGKNEQSARMLQARDKWRGREALHHAWRLSCIWYDQRSACRDFPAFGRRQIFRLDEKASAQLLIGIAGGICSYGSRGGAALLSSGRRTNRPKSHYGSCHYANIAPHGVLPGLRSHEIPPQTGAG
jgi:hypothetical protein